MTEMSLLRLHALRAAYALIAIGLGLTIWPVILDHRPDWPLMNGVTACLLGAMALMALLGLRYPLQMLPLLLFETLWKSIWLVVVALPLWSAHRIDPDTAETVRACLMGIVFPIVIPWRYVFTHYVRRPGDPWTTAAASGGAAPQPG